ncbi:MAG: nucleotide exchange factor GrpE [Candidatus Dormibacteraeota bacterium]|nr:nucleotide exchange factor GrpE [Candidatus Dormibacteraeota bacterium]MBO0744895.1 nucleotide exchange factor GrpE [Candidatus Dormibacteraeota bacterium]
MSNDADRRKDLPEDEAPGTAADSENDPVDEQPAEAAAEAEAILHAEELIEEANNRHLRLAADFDNFKKRVRQERLELLQYASASLAERMLPVLDDFERVLEHAPEGVDSNWLKGVRMTVQKLQDALQSVGVETIESVGAPFDPKLHEAIGTEESADQPEDTVVKELRRGYRIHDRVLRPALVSVARTPARKSS